MKILILTGPPYSGKGTQCKILANDLDLVHISTGEAIRLEKENETDIGKIMAQYEESGELVPDEFMEKFVRKLILKEKKSKGIILDGYPRTINQVDSLLKIIDNLSLKISGIINIDVPKDELLKRAEIRSRTSNRVDDKDKDKHTKRIITFLKDTQPAIELMDEIIRVETVSGIGEIEEITRRIKRKLKK